MPELHFEFVSPESVLFSGEVDQVDLPGVEGDMGILAGHAPLVTVLRPGIVTIYRGGAREPVVVTGGFAEVGPAGLTVLADRAVARADFDLGSLSVEIKDAEEDVADATDPGARDKCARHLAQLKALQDALGAAAQTGAH
jgi:F-type H+-transporting ATPase subunit epsilon